MAGDNDDAAAGGGAAEVDVESNRCGGARDNPNPPQTGRNTIHRVVLSGDLSPEEKLEAMKRKYNKNGDGVFQEQEVNNIFADLFSEVQSSEDLKQKNSYLGKKLAKNRKHSLAAIVSMGVVTIAASTSGLVAVNKSVNSSEEKVQGAIVESAFAETQVDDAGVAHLTDKAGRDLTTRATGDVFRAEVVQDPRSGRELTCVRVLEAAKMAGSVASGADARLAVADGASGLEREVLSLAGDYEDSGDALHFGGGKVHVLFEDDGCNVALQANAPDKDEVQDEAPPLEDAAVDETSPADDASPEDDAEAAEEDSNAGPFGRLRSLFARGSSAARSKSRARVNARSQADEDEGDRVKATPTNDARAQPEGEDVLARHRRIYAAGRAALNKAGSVAFKKGQRFLYRGDASAYVPVIGLNNGAGGNIRPNNGAGGNRPNNGAGGNRPYNGAGGNRPNNGVGSGNNQGGGAANPPEDGCPRRSDPVCVGDITYQNRCLALMHRGYVNNGPCPGNRGRFKYSDDTFTRADMTRFADENFKLVGEVEVRGPIGLAPNDGNRNLPGQQQDFAPPGQQEGFTPQGLEKQLTLVTAEGLMYATDDHQGNMPSEAELEELASRGRGSPPQAFGGSPEGAGEGSLNRSLVVFESDNRERVEWPYTDYHMRRVVAIVNSDSSAICTGVVVGRWRVLTSACCVYDCYGDNGWRVPTHVAPGRDSSQPWVDPSGNPTPDPWGRWAVLGATIPTAVINDGYSASRDVAILRIGFNVDYEEPWLIGDFLGIAQVVAHGDSSHLIASHGMKLAGYPGDKDPGQMWKDFDCGTAFWHGAGDTAMGHYCDTVGQSGSPIFDTYMRVFAVHTRDGPSEYWNDAFIFTSAWRSWVLSWGGSGRPYDRFENGDDLKAAVDACYGDNISEGTCSDVTSRYGWIENWQVGAVTDMSRLFQDKTEFNAYIGGWDVSSVTDMSWMFWNARSYNRPLNDWDTSSVTDMTYMFRSAEAFNQPLNYWDTSSVTNMRNMFHDADAFNQPLNNWDVSSVTVMALMFHRAEAFNQPLNNWITSSVTNMYGMFSRASSFNRPLNDWDTSTVTDMGSMFHRAEAFNQPLNNWVVSSVTTMYAMFWNARSFSQSLCWDLQGKDIDSMFLESPGTNQVPPCE